MKNEGAGAGFTLLEILIALGIVGVLATIGFAAFPPQTILGQARDGRRIQDLTLLNISISAFRAQTSGSLGQGNTVYVSLPDASQTCASYALPQLAAGWAYRCVSSQAGARADGTGWIPLNLQSVQQSAGIALDPANKNAFAYLYLAQGSEYELVSLVESEKYVKQYARADAGADDARFEIGSNLSLWPRAAGIAGKWSFDSVAAGYTDDGSFNNNAGQITNALLVPGKVGNALSFNGASFVQMENVPVATTSGAQNTVAFWMKWDGTPDEIVVGWNAPYGLSLDSGCLGFNVGQGNVLGVPYGSFVNTWVHIAAVFYNGVPAIENVRLYVNGKEQQLQNCQGSVVAGKNVTANVTLGASGVNQQNGFTGILDDMQIFARQLTSQEIWNLYAGTR